MAPEKEGESEEKDLSEEKRSPPRAGISRLLRHAVDVAGAIFYPLAPGGHPGDYRPVSITTVLFYRIYERLLAQRLTRFLDINKLLPSKFGFRKGLNTSDALVFIT